VPSSFREPERLPKERELHHWADYAELSCLISEDGLYAPSQLSVQIRRGRDNGEATVETTQGDAILDDRTIDALLGISESDKESVEYPGSPWDEDFDPNTSKENEASDSAVLADNLSRRVDDVWRHLQYRAKSFGDNWPFTLEASAQALTLRAELSDSQKVYLFLLQCALLRYRTKQEMSSLTKAFERASYIAFKAAFTGWEVHIFGTTSPSGSRFAQAQLWDRLVILSSDLRGRLLVDKEHVSDQNVGDNGLDLVAWLPLPEKSKGLPMAFAQCACGASNWKDKQAEATIQRWGEAIKLSAPIQNWLFIPFCFHGPQGDWETPFDVHNGVLADRLRIFHLLDRSIGDVRDLLGEFGLLDSLGHA
jgi:hypothetical protein